jgi:ribosomal protein L7Ae-like RNA K-turn-binding protein
MSKLATMLGFASKAGQLITGSAAVAVAIKRHRVHLVICAGDLAERTLRNFRGLCESNQIKFYSLATREELGHWIGRPERGVIGVSSKQFAGALVSLCEEFNTEDSLSSNAESLKSNVKTLNSQFEKS